MENKMMLDAMQKRVEPKSTLELDYPDLPAIADWQVGQQYKIILTVEMTGQDDIDGDGQPNAQFKIISAEAEQDHEANEGESEQEQEELSSEE